MVRSCDIKFYCWRIGFGCFLGDSVFFVNRGFGLRSKFLRINLSNERIVSFVIDKVVIIVNFD